MSGLVDDFGIVDTGAVYGQSVYATMGSTFAGQLQAMPSLHVGWAVVIGIAAMQVSASPWRWLGMAHAALASWVVVVTGNHYWLDGIVVVGLPAMIMAGQRAGRVGRRGQGLGDRNSVGEGREVGPRQLLPVGSGYGSGLPEDDDDVGAAGRLVGLGFGLRRIDLQQ